MPTFIGYCCFVGCIIVNIIIASVLHRVGTTNKYMQIFVSIYAYQNHWNKLISTSRPKKAVKSIDGVRAISMMWVMIAHLWTQLAFLGEQRYAIDALKNGEWSFITSGTPSVDSFFCVGGMLLAYLSTETIIKTFNSVPKFCMNWTMGIGFLYCLFGLGLLSCMDP